MSSEFSNEKITESTTSLPISHSTPILINSRISKEKIDEQQSNFNQELLFNYWKHAIANHIQTNYMQNTNTIKLTDESQKHINQSKKTKINFRNIDDLIY